MVETPEDAPSLTDLWRTLRRYLPWALGAALVMALGAYLVGRSLPPRYQSGARLVASQGVLSPTLGSLPQVALSLDGRAFREAALSREVRQLALRRVLGEGAPPLEEAERRYRFRANLVEGRISVVLTLSLQAPTPEEAKALAEAWAGALLEWDQNRIRQGFRQYRTSLEAQALALEKELENPTLSEQDRLSLQAALGNTLRDLQLARALEATASGQLALLDPASPGVQVFPRPLLFGALSGALGGFLVLLLGFLREGLDQSLRSPEEAHRLTGLPVLAEFPALPPGSPVEESEAFREAASYLRTSLTPLLAGEEQKVLLVTSPAPGEGKTGLALSLARAFARSGRKTLLVDADLRHPLLTRRAQAFYPGVPGEGEGLDRFLTSAASLPRFLPLEEGLWLLPAYAPLPDPAEALGREARNFFRYLEGLGYEVVVLDTPPLAFPDALVLAPRASGVLLVVAERRTDRRALQAAWDTLRQLGVRVLGLVVNRVREGRLWSGQGGYAYAYRYRYRYRRASAASPKKR